MAGNILDTESNPTPSSIISGTERGLVYVDDSLSSCHVLDELRCCQLALNETIEGIVSKGDRLDHFVLQVQLFFQISSYCGNRDFESCSLRYMSMNVFCLDY